MPIDDKRLMGLISARQSAARAGHGFESVTNEMIDEGEAPHAADVLGAVVKNLNALPEDEKGDPIAFAAALELLVSHSEKALQRYHAGERKPFARDERGALEAVVKADGSRPALLLKEGEANANHPLAGAWKDSIVSTRDAVRDLASSVGRIEPTDASSTRYFGTGWVVDSAKGFILTNRHVLDKALERETTVCEPEGAGYRIKEGVYIDFDCETGVDTVNRFRVVGAMPASAAGAEFAALDAAVLRIEPIPGDRGSRTPVPKPVRVRADSDATAKLSLPSMCVVGFPGPPPAVSGIQKIDKAGKINWAWVDGILFGSKYGLKRLAPGAVDRKAGHLGPADPNGWIFGHEATTLGGNSGSPVFAWTAAGRGYAFGLHYSGNTLVSNRAFAVAAAAVPLGKLGVPIEADDAW
ncbi:MAG: serine protease [Parvibaculaceae bacterium]